jgi:hypothetical protein
MRKPSLVAAAFFVLLLALIVPVAMVRLPPLLDYPNHLSRLWLLGGGAAIPPVSSMYRIEWTVLTNIGIDLLTVPLTRIFSAETVGAFYVALSIVLVPLGAALLNRTIYGGWHWWCLGFPIIAWNAAVLAGFLNFQIGIGLALFAAAADPALARRGLPQAFLVRVAIGALLTVIHLFGLFFYTTLLCGLALGPDLRALRDRAGLVQAAGRLLPVVAAVGLVLAGFLLTAPALPGAHQAADAPSLLDDVRIGFSELFSLHKAKSAFAWIWTYSLPIDLAVLVLALTPLALALIRGRLRVHAGLLLVLLALCVLFVLTPFQLAGAYWIDRRFAVMAPFVLAPALRPELPLRQMQSAAVLLFVLSLGRAAFIGYVWELRQSDVAAVERTLEHVPAGTAVLPVEHRRPPRTYGPLGRYFSGSEVSYGHYPTLAVRERHAFVPTLFTARGGQPVRVLPPWDAIATPGSWLVSVHSLTDPAVQQKNARDAPYVLIWQEHYDYVLVVNADILDMNGTFTPPPQLQLVADEGFAQLYRVLRNGSAINAAE